MRRTRWTSAVTWFVAAAVVSWVAGDLLLRHVGWVPVLSPWGAVTALVIAGIVLVSGLAVRRLRAREHTWIPPPAPPPPAPPPRPPPPRPQPSWGRSWAASTAAGSSWLS